MAASPPVSDEKDVVSEWLEQLEQSNDPNEFSSPPAGTHLRPSTDSQAVSSAEEDLDELVEELTPEDEYRAALPGFLDAEKIFAIRLQLLEMAMCLDGFGATAVSRSLGRILNRFWDKKDNNLLTVGIWNEMVERQGSGDMKWPEDEEMTWLEQK